MDRFLKRTEHPVPPVLPAPQKPKVYSKQGVISASTLKIRTSLNRFFLWKKLSNVPHGVIFKQRSTTTNYLRGGGGGGGVHPDYFVKLDFEISVDQQTRARDRTFEGVPDSG